MAFELQHASIKAFLVPNHATVNVKLCGEDGTLNDWEYKGFDDDKRFILLTKGNTLRWVPITSISYIEQVLSDTE